MHELTGSRDVTRLSRLRRTPALRALRRETRLHPTDLIQPIFVVENPSDAGPVESMPGVERLTLESLKPMIDAVSECGVPAIILFGLPETKDATGSSASTEDGVVPRAVRAAKRLNPDLAVITDVCLCQYTDHGHCGILHAGGIETDATLERLGAAAIAHAQAGADIVAPSAMLDGQVGAIRAALDDAAHRDTAILSYSVKHASAFYGPFRDAAHSAPSFGDRRAHQMDPANAREAIGEARQDAIEGADALMVKPAGPNLDIIRGVREAIPDLPLAAYQVSGEYAMICAASANGWLDERAVALESLTAIKRAGADMIITYWASRAGAWIREDDRW
jgi:porphobilinogen synthase